jgi:hypothetical protein
MYGAGAKPEVWNFSPSKCGVWGVACVRCVQFPAFGGFCPFWHLACVATCTFATTWSAVSPPLGRLCRHHVVGCFAKHTLDVFCASVSRLPCCRLVGSTKCQASRHSPDRICTMMPLAELLFIASRAWWLTVGGRWLTVGGWWLAAGMLGCWDGQDYKVDVSSNIGKSRLVAGAHDKTSGYHCNVCVSGAHTQQWDVLFRGIAWSCMRSQTCGVLVWLLFASMGPLGRVPPLVYYFNGSSWPSASFALLLQWGLLAECLLCFTTSSHFVPPPRHLYAWLCLKRLYDQQ